jgi:hypothetical protein
MPFVLGLPNGRKSLRDYCQDIRLLPMKPLGRNIILGVLMAALTLFSILLAALLSGHFVFDWSYVPALRWVKGLPRGIWEEVFFRGIILVLFMRVYPLRKAVFLSTFLFAVVHLNPMAINLEMIVDVVSIFFMGLLSPILYSKQVLSCRLSFFTIFTTFLYCWCKTRQGQMKHSLQRFCMHFFGLLSPLERCSQST